MQKSITNLQRELRFLFEDEWVGNLSEDDSYTIQKWLDKKNIKYKEEIDTCITNEQNFSDSCDCCKTLYALFLLK